MLLTPLQKQNRALIHRLGLEETLKLIHFQPLPWAGCPLPHAQGRIQPGFGYLQRWSTHSCPGSLEQQTRLQHSEAESSVQWGLPVDPIVGRLYGAVHLQGGLVVHVSQREALQGLVGSRSPEQGLDGKRGQGESSVTGREKVTAGREASGSSLLPATGRVL